MAAEDNTVSSVNAENNVKGISIKYDKNEAKKTNGSIKEKLKGNENEKIPIFMRTKFDKNKVSQQDLMTTTKQIKRAICNIGIVLLLICLGGCRHSSTGVKDLIDLPFGSVYVNIHCTQSGKNDTMELCYTYDDIVYGLEEDSLTLHLCNKIDDYILKGELLVLPENHFLLQRTIIPDSSVDSIYSLGYNRLFREYFFCYDNLKKERSCCLDWLHSACGNSVYFGHWRTPYYYKDGDDIMDDNKQKYIISLLYKNNIFCMMDENGNIRLLDCNMKKEDFYHIPFPIVEIR